MKEAEDGKRGSLKDMRGNSERVNEFSNSIRSPSICTIIPAEEMIAGAGDLNVISKDSIVSFRNINVGSGLKWEFKGKAVHAKTQSA